MPVKRQGQRKKDAGKGKGVKGGFKGSFKGDGKGFGKIRKGKGSFKGAFKGAWNPNNFGYGYQGVCWYCGEVGHKAAECGKRVIEVFEETGVRQEGEAIQIAGIGVWDVCRVEDRSFKPGVFVKQPIEVKNRLEGLEVTDEDFPV
jgi:hypothetical protein